MPIYTTFVSGSGTSGSLPNMPIRDYSIGAEISGSLHVSGPSSVSGSLDVSTNIRSGTGLVISANGINSTGNNEITGDTNQVGAFAATGYVTSSLGLITTGTIFVGHANGGTLRLSRDDATIVADELIGAIEFYGHDSNGPGVGARIVATASAAYANDYRRSTDLKFFTQNADNGVNSLEYARLTISGSGIIGIDQGLTVYASASMNALQVGTSADGNLAPDPNTPFRVSNDNGNVAISIDSSTNKVSSLVFEENGAVGSQLGWYTDWNADAGYRLSLRGSGESQEDGAIVVKENASGNTMGTVRIGGGGAEGNYEGDVCLLITSSVYTDPSKLLIRADHGKRSTQGAAVLGIAWDDISGNANSGYWEFCTDPTNGFLKIGSPNPGTSAYGRSYSAMTFRKGGTNASVGIGGYNFTTPYDGQVACLVPTGTLHVENKGTAVYSNTLDLGNTTQLLVRNSYGSTDETVAGMYLDCSNSEDLDKYSAHILAVNDGAAADHDAYLSIGLYDGSGNVDSTRSRLRIDSQGAMIIMSGTNPIAGNNGFPKNAKSNWRISDNDIPSGSLTVVSLMDGTKNDDPATISLVSWTGAAGKGNVTSGDNMGRIQWWSADSNFGAGEENQTVGAYIQAVAAGAHNDTNFSPMAMQFFVRNTGGVDAALAMEIKQTGIVEFNQAVGFVGGSIDITAAQDSNANLFLYADQQDDAGDAWKVSAKADQTFAVSNDKRSAGSYVDHLAITSSAGASTASTVGIAGKLIVSGGYIDVHAPNSGVASLSLIADDGDSNGDAWSFTSVDADNTLIFENNISGAPVPHMTIVPDGTVTNSIVKVEGKLAVLSGKIVNDADGTCIQLSGDVADGAVTLGTGVGLVTVTNDLQINGDEITAAADLTITPTGGQVYIKGDFYVIDENSTDTICRIYDSSDDGVLELYANNSITTQLKGNGTSYFNAPTSKIIIGGTSGNAQRFVVFDDSAGGTGADDYAARIKNTQASNSLSRRILGLNFSAADADSTADYFARMHTDDTSDLEYYIRGDGVTSQTFTGQHWVIFVADSNSVNAGGDMSSELEPGMIIESTGEVWIRKDVETTIPKVSKCSTVNSKKVFGVMSSDYASGLDMAYWNHNSDTMNTASAVPAGSEVDDKGTYSSASTEFKCRVNSIGEGSLWVTDINDDVTNGDYITSSAIAGYGQLQDDDLLHNYTVAKCTETIDWNSVTDTIEHEDQTYKKYLVACTYHCG